MAVADNPQTPASPASATSMLLDWRWALPRIALVFLVTRLLVLGVAVAVEATQPPPAAGVRMDARPVLASLSAWDGRYYMGIAADGYHAEPVYGAFVDYAFFPLYPALIRLASMLTLGDMALAAVLVANAAFALALGALFALSVRYLTPERSIRALWYLALAPGAVAFALAYSDSLFLLLAVAAFLAAETRHPWLAGLAYALATLTRPPGVLLALPLLVLYVQRDGRRPSPAWLALLLGPLALAVFFGYLWQLTGDPLAAVHAQGAWGEPNPAGAADAGGRGTATIGISEAHPAIVVLWFGTLVAYLALFVLFRSSRIAAPYWLVAILAVASVFLAGRLMSAPRYLAAAWPFDWVLAGLGARWIHFVLSVVLVAVSVVFAWLVFSWSVPP